MIKNLYPKKHVAKNGAVSYRVKFRFNGSQYQRVLTATSADDAEIETATIKAVANKLEQGQLAVPDGMTAIDFIMAGGVESTVRAVKRRTIENLRTTYLTDFCGDLAQSTREEYEGRMRAVCGHLGSEKLLEDLVPEDLIRFAKKRMKSVAGSTAKRDVLRFLDAYSKIVIPRDWVSRDRLLQREKIIHGVSWRRDAKAKPKFRTLAETLDFVDLESDYLTDDDLSQVWMRCYLDEEELTDFTVKLCMDDDCPAWLRTMVIVAMNTGMRRLELCDLRRKHVARDLSMITVPQRKRDHKRYAGSERQVPVSKKLKPILKSWLEHHCGCDSLFYEDGDLPRSKSKSDGPRPITHDTASDRLKRIVGGLEGYASIAGRWHIFRHSFISLCAAKGVGKPDVMEWCGHLSAAISDHYTHLSSKKARNSMALLG